MALGSTQPLTEMSTRRISWGPMRNSDDLPPSCPDVTKSGNFNFLEPSKPVTGLIYLYLLLGLKKIIFLARLLIIFEYVVNSCFIVKKSGSDSWDSWERCFCFTVSYRMPSMSTIRNTLARWSLLSRAVLAQNRGISPAQNQERCYHAMSLMDILFLLT
jgi:hypothetical protein